MFSDNISTRTPETWTVTAVEFSALVQDLASLPGETEWVEFKESRAEPDEVGEYISALANSAALHGRSRAYVVWGVRNGSHAIVGTSFRPAAAKVGNEDLEPWVARLLSPRIDFRFHEGVVGGKPVTLLEIPAANHLPVRFRNDEYIRVGSYRKKLRDYPEKERVLWQTFARTPFEDAIARPGAAADDVLELIDFAAYFTLMNVPVPGDPAAILERLQAERFVVPTDGGWFDITNLGAIAFGKDLGRLGLGRKAMRVIVYRGSDRVETQREKTEEGGYGASFERLIEHVNAQLPTNEHIGRALRRVEPMYPELAVRELIANALIHQDLYITGTGPMIEIFDDRVEITNPGRPLIEPDRFIDKPPLSRNENLAALMRRLNVCEERGTGIDKVISTAEVFQLPAPDFIVTELHTRAVLFAPRSLGEMSREDRTRACYQHAALQHVSNRQMTNATLRERFNIAEKNYAMASRIIADTIDAGLIKPFDPANRSRKHARYIPYWA
jgi:ATP-dependent DNA helicase RecG